MNDNKTSGMSADTKTLVTIICLICVYPVGLILMWLWMKWKLWVKFLVTVPVVLTLLIIIGAFVIGFLAVFNPQGAFQQGQCVSKCAKNYVKSSSQYDICISQCTGPLDTANE
jgi:ABC-type spermidine/putrescine transport system permease subunit I